MLRGALLCAIAAFCAAATEHTKPGGPCAELLTLEEDYVTRAEEKIFNIVDPSTSIQ